MRKLVHLRYSNTIFSKSNTKHDGSLQLYLQWFWIPQSNFYIHHFADHCKQMKTQDQRLQSWCTELKRNTNILVLVNIFEYSWILFISIPPKLALRHVHMIYRSIKGKSMMHPSFFHFFVIKVFGLNNHWYEKIPMWLQPIIKKNERS